MPPKAYSYARFSSNKQKDGHSLQRQLDIARGWYDREISPLGLPLDYLTCDEGYSAFKGLHIEKGSLGHFLALIKRGDVPGGSILIAENLDRISRQGPKIARRIIEQVVDNGVDLHICNIGIKLTYGWENDYRRYPVDSELERAWKESEYKSERETKAWDAKRERAAQDRRALTARVPAWLTTPKVEKNGQPITVIEERAVTVRRIFELAGLGLGCKRIANTLVSEGHEPFSNGKQGQEWSAEYISKLLENRSVIGEYQPRSKGRPTGDPIPNFFPAVVDFSVFEAARQQVEAKNRNLRSSGKPGTGGGRGGVNSLFNPLVRDITGGGDLPMVFHPGKNSYLVTKWMAGRKGNRHWLRYRRFESAFLGFLGDLEWKSVAGESEPEELKAKTAALSKTNGEIDRTAKLIARRETAMADPELDIPTSKVFATAIARGSEKLADLTLERERLGAEIEAIRKSAESLYSPQALTALVRRPTPESAEVRLRLKAEIRKRIARIDIDFGASFEGSLAIYHEQDRAGKFVDIAPDKFGERAGPLIRIRFINGAERIIVLDGDRAVLLWMKA